jgi:hypothetical protein
LEGGQLTFFIRDVEIFAYAIFFQYFSPFISLTLLPCHRFGIAVDQDDKQSLMRLEAEQSSVMERHLVSPGEN